MVEDKHKAIVPVFNVVKVKETEEEKVYTFIGASTLPDRTGGRTPDGKKIEGEVLSKKVLDKFASNINDTTKLGGKYGSFRTISLFHDRVINQDYTREEAGFVIPGSAKVLELEDYPGNFGLFLDAKVNKMYNPPSEYSDYTPEKIEYKIDNYAMGLSLEYNNTSEQETIVQTDKGFYRFIHDSDDFRGFGFARPDLIGNPTAVRVKEVYPQIEKSGSTEEGYTPSADILKNKEGESQMEEAKMKELADAKAKVEELTVKVKELTAAKEDAKVKELQEKIDGFESKIKEIKLSEDATAQKIKESLELGFSSMKFDKPVKTKEQAPNAKIKEAYESMDWVKFKEISDEQIEKDSAKLKELFAEENGFNFEKYQTLKVKCVGSNFVVVPTAKTKDVIDNSSMAESTYYQTNAMFADRYVSGITETFLKADNLLSAMTKEQHLGGNDKYQWKIWVDYTTVTGDNTSAVDPLVTSVARTKRKFEKMETRICEYREGVEVTDFTQHHSMASVGDLLGIEIERAAQVVVESMNADLFKPKSDATAGWNGFVGLIGVADSTTYSTIYSKVRSTTNRLLDSTLANTYDATSEGITIDLIREGYENVLSQGSNLGDLAIVIHPAQCRKLFNSEDAAIRNNILSMSGAPASFGFNRTVIPHADGIPMIRDYRCELSAGSADMFAVVDMSKDKGFNLVVSKPLGVRGLGKVGTSESAYVNFYGAAVYKAPRNVFVHVALS